MAWKIGGRPKQASVGIQSRLRVALKGKYIRVRPSETKHFLIGYKATL
jgi:hypothetical protein